MKTRTKKWMSVLILGCLLMLISGRFAYAQIERWTYMHSGAGTANSIVYGQNDTIYAAGYIDLGTDGNDFVTVGLDTAGTEAWLYFHEGPGTGFADDDRANAVVYGNDGNIYTAGFVMLAGYSYDFCVSGLTPDGNERWVTEIGNPSGTIDEAKAIAYGADDNIYVAGYSDDAAPGDMDFVVVKFDTAGNFVWYYTYVTSDEDMANALVYGADDNIYAAGYATNTDKDFVVASIDNLLNENWVYTYDASGGDEAANSIVYGPDGNIYAAGYNASNNGDFFVVSLDAAGNENWTYSYDGPGNDADAANSIIYGDDANLYVAGYSTATNNDFTVISLDNLGNERWVYSYNGMNNLDDEANAIVYGGDDNIYAAGFVRSIVQRDFAVVCLDTAGGEIWIYATDGGAPMLANDAATSVVYGGDGNIYVGGYLMPTSSRTFVVISLDPRPMPVQWSYPNFFMITLDIGETEERTLKIANIGTEGSTLNWSLSERPPVDWLSEDSTSGSLSADDTVSITVTFDATYLVPGSYYDTLEITSDDPNNPSEDVPVRLNVQSPGVEEHQTTIPEDRCELLSLFFNNEISLKFTRPTDSPLRISLYNVLGVPAYETSIPATPSLLNLDDISISRLSNGVYFLLVSQDEKTYRVRKLIKF